MKKSFKGSALVFSLIILFMILTAALGVASVSVVEKRNSMATGKSTQAFQVADSAMEIVLKKGKLNPTGTTLGSLGNKCTGGVVEIDSVLGGSAVLTFEDIDKTPIQDCTKNLGDAFTVKAVGKYGNTVRAVSTAVATGNLNWNKVETYHSPYRAYSGNEVYCAKDSRTGLVYLKGMVNTSSGGTSGGDKDVLTLPEECWPPSWKMFGVTAWSPSAALAIRMDIESSGKIDFTSVTQVDIISFNGISFPTS